MAKAKKCNRCGKLYEHLGKRDICILKDMHPYPTESLDLCEECYKKLTEWLNNKYIIFDSMFSSTNTAYHI